MECVTFEKKAYDLLMDRITKLKKRVDELYPAVKSALEEEWIENAELSRRLNISLRTLQTYRERGAIGSSMIGRKIYYKTSEIKELLESSWENGEVLTRIKRR